MKELSNQSTGDKSMNKRYLIKAGQDDMQIVDAEIVKDVYDQFLLNYVREDIEVCHVSDDDEGFEFYEISDEEYAELGLGEVEEIA